MKNPSIAAAFVLVALALLVGGLALAGGDDAAAGDAQVLTASAPTEKASFETLSPHELRKKGRMEEAKRELQKIRKVGEEILPNVFRIKDETGDATLYYGDLIPGVGRNGEPLYLMAQYKKLPAVPLKKPNTLPSSATKLKKDPVKAIQFNGKGKGGKGGDTPPGGDAPPGGSNPGSGPPPGGDKPMGDLGGGGG